jgi:hypothetical protein
MQKIELEHTYGKAIDDLIAEQVMGWKPHRIGYWGVKPDDKRPNFREHPETAEQKQLERWFRKHYQFQDQVGSYWIDLDSVFCIPQKLWMPSTDIEQAYRVLRKAMRLVPQADMHIEHLAGTGWCCSTCFDEEVIGKWKITHAFDTLPQAMCAVGLMWCKPKDLEIVWPNGVLIPEDEDDVPIPEYGMVKKGFGGS